MARGRSNDGWRQVADRRGWERDPDDDRDPYDTGRTAYHGQSAAYERRRLEERLAYERRAQQSGRSAARSTGLFAKRVAARIKRAADADGADESGMSALLGAQALHSAGDAMILVALASTVFFDVELGEARGKVALYLVLTLMPFCFLIPVAAPILDRFPHGRRNVLAATAIGRAFVAWQLASSLDGLDLFPLALTALVLSRAHGVARSAAMPRVRPPGLTLVAANARVNVASVSAAGLGAAAGGALSVIGTEWVLRAAAVVMVVAAVFAIRLPSQIDSDRHTERKRAPRFRLLEGPPHVLQPLVAAVALRGLAGFLTIFLAFLLREQSASTRVVAIVVGSVVGGQLVGTALASRLSAHVTRKLTTAALALPIVGCLAAAVLGGAEWAALAAGLTGVAYSLTKFALDASLQSNVPTVSTSGALSRSETAMQLSFALGGLIAVALPANALFGFAVATLIPIAGVVVGQRAKQGLTILPPLPGLSRRVAVANGTGVSAEPRRRPAPRPPGRRARTLRRQPRPGHGELYDHDREEQQAERRTPLPEEGAVPRPRSKDPDRPWWAD